MTGKLILIVAAFCTIIEANAQEALKYKLPPEEIVRIVDAAPTP